MSSFTSMDGRAEVPMLVAFVDLTGWAKQCARVEDSEIASAIDGWYERVAARVTSAGGRVVKYIGDAALIVFDAHDADRGALALLAIKAEGDAYFASIGWDCRVHSKAHVGPVIAGGFGAGGDKRFDVIGRHVNTAALLDSSGLALSVAAFRALSPELRKRFKKHSAPVTYIRIEDPHRTRR